MRLVANAAASRVLATAAMVAMLGTSAALAQGQRGPDQRPTDRGSNVTDHVQTVSDLAAVCDPQINGMRRFEAIAYCQGYLTAAGQFHALMYPAGGPMRPLYCISGRGPSIAEAGLGFSAWARAHPGRGNEPALDGFLRYAQERFPCPDAPRPGRNRAHR